MSKELKHIRIELQRQGWRIEQGRKQFKCYHPKGGLVSMAITPSCPFAARHVVADIKRLEQRYEEKTK